jgi:uncharacterized lipoprotein YmbA
MGDRFDIDAGGRAVSIIPKFYCTAVFLFMLFLLFFTGCAGNERPRFYALDYLARAPSGPPGAGTAGLSVGIGPVYLPAYLDRQEIVTRVSRYKLDIAEDDKWVAPLNDSFSRVLAENLSTLLSTDRIYVFPWNASRRLDYQILIDIIQFDGTIPGNANLMARWSLLKAGEETRVVMKKFQSRKPIAGQGYSGLVTSMSLGIVDLSREIADAILSEQRAEHAD